MSSIRELRSRIKSVQATKKITKAQELIATSRIARSQALANDSKPYAEAISDVVVKLFDDKKQSPFFVSSKKTNRVAVLAVTSDSGQCGAYNSNIFKATEALITRLKHQDKKVSLYVTGKKGISYFNFKNFVISKSWFGFSQHPNYEIASEIGVLLWGLFASGISENKFLSNGISNEELNGVDEIYLVYTKFVSNLTQKPLVIKLAPADLFEINSEKENSEQTEVQAISAEYEFEPNPEVVLGNLLTRYVVYKIYAAFLEAAASENASRRTAMQAATDNATQLEQDLSRKANLVRQANITQEISEIVGGKIALELSS